MCGIVGVIDFSGEILSEDVAKNMLGAIAHRGPDGEGVYFDSQLMLGHRRLSIIDLDERSAQPMTCDDNRYTITYNGELYNYLELKDELRSIGYSFKTESDTEVILQSYAEWGEKCVERFNGMFAFGLWDTKSKSLFLARDRYGIKPLYIYRQGDVLIFASEIKAIKEHPKFENHINYEGLLEYFTFQNFFLDHTLHKNVDLMEAGTYTKIHLSGKRETKKYWDYNFSEKLDISDAEAEEEFVRLFEQAVKRQLMSDVPVGSYLSGGMDSGSITAVAATELPYIKTFTCGFDLNSISGLEIRFDERAKAEYMSYLFKTEHYEMVLKSGDMERIMPKLTYHLEEPRVGQSYPNFYVAQLASKFVTVCLSGAGGDELFGGYPWRYYRGVNSTRFDQYVDNYYHFWQRLIPNKHIKQVFKPIWNNVSHVWTRDIFQNVLRNLDIDSISTPEDYLDLSQYLEAKTFLHGLLMVEDKLSMASGLEARVPFLDNDLVDFALKLPAHLRVANLNEVVKINENEDGNKRLKHFIKTNDGKLLMRRAMKKYIPDEVTNRVKQGFSAPDASWFKGDSIDYVRETICDKNAEIYNFLDYASVEALVNEHLSGQENRRLFIWSLLYFENWCKQNL